jgi:hypothetical protein
MIKLYGVDLDGDSIKSTVVLTETPKTYRVQNSVWWYDYRVTIYKDDKRIAFSEEEAIAKFIQAKIDDLGDLADRITRTKKHIDRARILEVECHTNQNIGE